MSHFSCIVVSKRGQDPDRLLQPFDEALRESEPYWNPVSKSILEWAQGNLGVTELARAMDMDLLELVAAHLTEEGDSEEYKVVNGEVCYKTSSNRRGKWDYHVQGWGESGYFPTISGECVNSVRKSKIDFNIARKTARESAKVIWDSWQDIVKQHGMPISWPEMRKDCTNSSEISFARNRYHEQPAIVAATGTLSSMRCPVVMFGPSEEQYLLENEMGALVPFAMLWKDVWYQRQQAESGDYVEDDWYKQVHDLYAAIPDSAILSIHDCHT